MPVEIREKEFTRVLRGYDPKEVRVTLDEIAEDFGHILDENRKLLEKLSSFEKLESSLKDTLILAQKAAEDTKKNADLERENIIKAAHEEAKKISDEVEKILAKAKNDAKSMEKDMKEREKKIFSGIDERKIEVETELHQLVARRNSFKAHFKSLLSSYLEDITREESISSKVEEAKVEEGKAEENKAEENKAESL